MEASEAALTSYLSELRYDDLPATVAHEATLRTLDTVGVAVAGASEEAARLAIQYACARGGTPESSVHGSPGRVDAEFAAFANGVCGHVLELDDGNRFAMGHAGVVVVPAVLALAEAEGRSGREALAAIVVGYEAFVRLGSAVNPSHYGRGFHTTGTVGTVAAAAACAHLLGLGGDAFRSAVGLAVSQAGGLFEFLADGAMSKQLHAGHAAAAGIRSVRLAAAGFTGPVTGLQGRHGFLRAFADEVDPERLDADLGERWAVENCYVKLHACCRHIHPVVDAVLQLQHDHGLAPDDVERVAVGTYTAGAKLDARQVGTELAAKMSIPYSVAITLHEGACGLGQFRREAFADPRVNDLMARVEVALDADLDARVPHQRGARVEVVTTDGGVRRSEVALPRGEPESPVEEADLLRKYRDLAEPRLGEASAHALERTLLDLASRRSLADWLPIPSATAPAAAGGARLAPSEG